MSIKFNYDQFTITTDFANDFNLSMTVLDNYSGDYFINEKIELTKIRKDTIIATLSRKNQQHLKCEFSVIDVEPKKLAIEFRVSFDFLPTFTEYISLDQISNKKGLNKIETADIINDIKDIDNILSLITVDSGRNTYSEQTHTISQSAVISKQQLTRGSYMVQITAFLMIPGGGSMQKNDLLFTFELGKQKSQVGLCAYTNSGYGYPVSLRKELIVCQNSPLQITAKNVVGLASNLHNTLVTISPMLKL